MAAVEEGVKNMNINEKPAQKQQGSSKKEKKKKEKNKDDGGTSGFPVEVKFLAPSSRLLFFFVHTSHSCQEQSSHHYEFLTISEFK